MILVLNCGSQSIKWKLFDNDLNLEKAGKAEILDARNFQKVLEQELKGLMGQNISMIGHRVVHGGNLFVKPARITHENIKDLENISHLAPLHNPYNVLGIKACQKFFEGRPNIAVFDTEFFADLPDRAKFYALPEDVAGKFGFKRYGFHGTSHEYAGKEAAKKLKKDFKKLKIISCHLGGGSSVSAIKNGKALDTSMGFTPLEGVPMSTRSGSIDPGIVLEMAKELGIDRTKEILNKESGMKGLCQESGMLEVLQRAKNGDKKAQFALDFYAYSIKKYIGAYYALLQGCDVLVFTGSIGAGDKKTRNAVCSGLNILNKTKILAIHADEELAIAQKIKNL